MTGNDGEDSAESAEEGSVEEGSAEEGSAKEGSAEEGSVEEGDGGGGGGGGGGALGHIKTLQTDNANLNEQIASLRSDLCARDDYILELTDLLAEAGVEYDDPSWILPSEDDETEDNAAHEDDETEDEELEEEEYDEDLK